MDDKKIVDLYWQRNEAAISATKEKYDAYLFGIAFRIVSQFSDSEECVNDTCLGAWEAIYSAVPNVQRSGRKIPHRGIGSDR